MLPLLTTGLKYDFRQYIQLIRCGVYNAKKILKRKQNTVVKQGTFHFINIRNMERRNLHI